VDGVLKPIGLLLEGAATNLVDYSENFVPWNTNGTTLSANVINGPFDSSLRASEVFPTTESIEHRIESSLAALANAEYTQSVYVKASGTATGLLRVIHIGESEATSSISFDLSTETIEAASGRVTKTSIEKLANGWFRLSVTYTLTSTTAHRQRILPKNSTAYSGDTTSSLYIWGAQTEEGSYPTSYIPTQGSQVTRAADVSSSPQVTRASDDCVSMLGDEFNPNQFSVFFDYKLAEGVLDVLNLSSIRVFGFSDGTNNNRLSLAVTTLLVSDSGVTSTYSLTTNLTQRGKVAISYDGTTLKVCLNGGIILTQSSSKNAELDRMLVGSSEAVSAGAIIVKQEILFPTALSEAELITLTGGA
jgi:hypothetical protein